MRSLRGVSSHRPRTPTAASRFVRVFLDSSANQAGCCSTPALALALLVQVGLASAQVPAQPSVPDVPAVAAPARERVILLVRTPGDDGVMNRVRAELAASSWRILELRLDERAGRVPLARVAAEQDVRAAVRLDPASAQVELWIEGRSGEVEETLASGEDRGDDLVLAYRITEALRARGLELGPEPASGTNEAAGAAATHARSESAPPVHADAQQAAKPSAPARPEPSPTAPAAVSAHSGDGLWLGAGPALDVGTGGLGPAALGWLGVRFGFASRWSVGVFAALPMVPQSLSASEGSASVSNYLFGSSLALDWLTTQRFRASAGLGVSYALSSMRGEGAEGYVGVPDTVTALVPFAEAAGRVVLSRRLALSASVLGGLAFPEISVQFADQARASWGRPVLLGSLGVEVRVTSATTQ